MVPSSDRHDDVEALLAEAKSRGHRLRTRRRQAAIGGAGAVLLLGIMAAVLVTRSPAGTKLNVVGPSTPHPVPTSPPVPAPSGVSPSSTAVPVTAPPCLLRDLGAQGSWQGAGGSMAGGVVVVNNGREPCSVQGQPTIGLYDQHGQRLNVLASHPSTPLPAATPVLLAPHSSPASVLVQWFNWCGSDPGPVVARLSLPSGTESTTVAPPIGLIPHCNNPASPSTLDVGNFTPG